MRGDIFVNIMSSLISVSKNMMNIGLLEIDVEVSIYPSLSLSLEVTIC